MALAGRPGETDEMEGHPSITLSFADFLRQVTRVREVMDTPAGRGIAHEAGVEPAHMSERLRLVERIGAAMTTKDIAAPTSLSVADRERVALGSGVSVTEVNDLLARYRRAVADTNSS